MILAKSASRYSAVSPRVDAIAFIRSTSKPMILPLGSLNSFGVYGTFTPTMSLPDDLMSSGTVFAMSSTLAAIAAVVSVVGPEVSVFLVQPDRIRALDTAITAAPRHQRDPPRRC